MNAAFYPHARRPRERLHHYGRGSLSDAELLALLLQTGVKGRSALDLAGDLLGRYPDLASLLATDPTELCRQPGVGPAQAARLAATWELYQRVLVRELCTREVLGSSAATRKYLLARFHGSRNEAFVCVFLTSQNHVIGLEELFRGTIDGAAVYPREVVTRCIHHNAAAVIFAHNHPSGVAEPSQADISITRKLIAALATIDVRVLDHLVVGYGEVVSLAERGLL